MITDDRVTIPGLADEEPALAALDAHAIAKSAGVRLSVSVWETAIGPWGMVLDQRPESGTCVRRGGSLRVIVSGRPHAPVPEVRGLLLATTIEGLSWLGFVPLVKARRASNSVPAGHIVSTCPSAGTLLTDGSVVALTVARSAEKSPSSVARAR